MRRSLRAEGGSLTQLALLNQIERERDTLIALVGEQWAHADPPPTLRSSLPRDGGLSFQAFLRRDGWAGSAFYGSRVCQFEAMPTLSAAQRHARAFWLSFRLQVD